MSLLCARSVNTCISASASGRPAPAAAAALAIRPLLTTQRRPAAPWPCAASSSGRTPSTSSSSLDQPALMGSKERVDEVMTHREKVVTCSPCDSIDKALELLVEHRITGLPVVDEAGTVVGVVSDFDLLALETFGSTRSADLFPQAEQTWQAFMAVRKVLAKGTGRSVADVMTINPITVRRETNINEATSILLRKKIRRLPVVDEEGRLLGLLSRRDIVKSALEARRRQDRSLDEAAAAITASR